MKDLFVVKRLIRLILAIVSIFMLISRLGWALASSAEVSFFSEDYSSMWSFDNVTVYSNEVTSINDLFGLTTKELAPGMWKTSTLRLENPSDETYDFYLIAKALTGMAAREVEMYHQGKTASDSLLNVIDTVVTYKGGYENALVHEIYRGKIGGFEGAAIFSKDGVVLGRLVPSEAGTITVTIHIPEGLGNSYMGTLCALEWQFVARAVVPLEESPPGTIWIKGSDAVSNVSKTGAQHSKIEADQLLEESFTYTDKVNKTASSEAEKDIPDVVVRITKKADMPETAGNMTSITQLVICLLLLIVMLMARYIWKRDKIVNRAT